MHLVFVFFLLNFNLVDINAIELSCQLLENRIRIGSCFTISKFLMISYLQEMVKSNELTVPRTNRLFII